MFKAITIAVAACGLFAAPAAAEDAKYVKIVHKETGKVLAVKDNSEEAGARVMIAKDDGSEAQQWKIEKDGDHLKITNRKSGKLLDVEGGSTDEGGGIIQWHEKTDDIDNQRWSWEGDGKTRRLKAKSSKLVLEIGDEDVVVQKKADEKSKAQLWEVVEIKK
jgi:hypothetical protein